MVAALPDPPPPEPPVAPVPVQAVDPATVRTIAARCADATYDPYKGAFQGPFGHFGPVEGADNAGVLTQTLLTTNSTAPIFFAGCVHYTPHVQRVIVLHHPFRVTALFGQQSEFDGRSFALIGNVIEN
jgi:hypothetical protein